MASTKEYLDFVMEQLSGLDEVSSRAMMGEYILYYRGRIFGGVYDDRLLVKPVPMALRLMPDAEMEQPGIQCLSQAKKYKLYKNSINKSIHFVQRSLSSSTRG